MSVTLASLRALHPEFTDTPDDVVQGCIDSAETQLHEGVFGTQYDVAVDLLACHLIATSPFGSSAKLINDSGVSIYKPAFDRIARAVGRAYRVLSA